jgi:hypothetical protein
MWVNAGTWLHLLTEEFDRSALRRLRETSVWAKPSLALSSDKSSHNQ